jgi:hypothetical protein
VPLSLTLRQSDPGAAELVLNEDGSCHVYPLTTEQLRLLAEQSVTLLCRHLRAQPPLDTLRT